MNTLTLNVHTLTHTHLYKNMISLTLNVHTLSSI